jgi:pyrimidine deaminase RibD-like protein
MRLCEAIDEAISCAEQADQPFRHGCVIMSGKKMVSNGFNHVRKNIGTYSVHAEMDALWKLNTDAYDNLKAVIVRVSKTGYLGNSRPCTIFIAPTADADEISAARQTRQKFEQRRERGGEE